MTVDDNYRVVSPFAHDPYAFQMLMCKACGSLVFDIDGHDRWHALSASTTPKEPE